MPDIPTEAAIRAAVRARLETLGYSTERPSGRESDALDRADALIAFTIATFAAVTAWLLWNHPPPAPVGPFSMNRAFAVLAGAIASYAACAFASVVCGLKEEGRTDA